MSVLEHGREVLGRVRQGGIIPLSVTIGAPAPTVRNFFAVFRDLSRAARARTN